ncbi:response regulator transcription factor [bacterium]|nr:response regulator transcription factor [bacterium]
MKIIAVEDEAKVLNFIQKSLSQGDITVDPAKNIDELYGSLLSAKYDVIILDRLLNGVDSLTHIAEIRKKAPESKILILSALSDVDEKVKGLSGGADDYLAKPFHVQELLARIRALTRRAGDTPQNNSLTFEDINVQLDTQRVSRSGKKVDLTAKEYKLLTFLMKKPNRIFSKAELINQVWELNFYPESNIVEVVVNHLRNKIDKGFEKTLLHSRRGTGYWIGEKDL